MSNQPYARRWTVAVIATLAVAAAAACADDHPTGVTSPVRDGTRLSAAYQMHAFVKNAGQLVTLDSSGMVTATVRNGIGSVEARRSATAADAALSGAGGAADSIVDMPVWVPRGWKGPAMPSRFKFGTTRGTVVVRLSAIHRSNKAAPFAGFEFKRGSRTVLLLQHTWRESHGGWFRERTEITTYDEHGLPSSQVAYTYTEPQFASATLLERARSAMSLAAISDALLPRKAYAATPTHAIHTGAMHASGCEIHYVRMVLDVVCVLTSAYFGSIYGVFRCGSMLVGEMVASHLDGCAKTDCVPLDGGDGSCMLDPEIIEEEVSVGEVYEYIPVYDCPEGETCYEV